MRVQYGLSSNRLERHDFSWEVLCDCIGIASVTSPEEKFLCKQHYQQVCRLLNAKSEACQTSGVKPQHVHSATASTINFLPVLILNGLSPFSRIPLSSGSQ